MNRLLRNRLVLQLLFTVVAAVSLFALSVALIGEAIRSAESVLVGDANKAVETALRELKQQQQYRALSDPFWATLPPEAKDVSLRAITQTVLRSYPGVEGGFYTNGQLVGYAYPTHDTGAAKTDVPSAERGLITALAQRSLQTDQVLHQVIRGKLDLLVLGAAANPNRAGSAWAMKRLAGRANANGREREILLAILVAAALASIAGTLATGISLARGVAQINAGLSTLEKDFDHRLPERKDELGSISRCINQMATTRRKLESDLRREDRLRALGRLAAGLAHEIRNPLNSIRLTVQLLQHRLKAGRLRSEDLDTVQAEVDRLSVLLNDLLDLQRTRQPDPKVQPVLPVVQHCVSVLERQAEMQGTHVSVHTPAGDVFALFDARQVTQTAMNLLLNALEVSQPGGTVDVYVVADNGAVKLEVRDEGPGLDAEQQEHLFEPFYTTKASGTGLGLAVSRELMRSQGGDLLYDSDSAGARFIVLLPSAKQERN